MEHISSWFMLMMLVCCVKTCEGVSKNYQTGALEQELQMIQLSATRCSYIAIL